MSGKTKALSTEENEFLRRLLADLIETEGTQVAAAEKLGVRQGYLNDFLQGRRGGGGKLMRGFAKVYPQHAPRILGLQGSWSENKYEWAFCVEKAASLADPRYREHVPGALRQLKRRGWNKEEEPEILDAIRTVRLHGDAGPVALANAVENALLGQHGVEAGRPHTGRDEIAEAAHAMPATKSRLRTTRRKTDRRQ